MLGLVTENYLPQLNPLATTFSGADERAPPRCHRLVTNAVTDTSSPHFLAISHDETGPLFRIYQVRRGGVGGVGVTIGITPFQGVTCAAPSPKRPCQQPERFRGIV